MKLKARKIMAILMLISVMFSLAVSAYAADDSEPVDILVDHNPMARVPSVPTILWDWDRGEYTGSFNIVQFTNTNYYFKPNSAGKIYYAISGTSTHNEECEVRTCCETCDGDEIASYSFTPSTVPPSNPDHRVVTVGSAHRNHNIYFKIVAYDGPEFFSNNDFKGTIVVSDSSTL